MADICDGADESIFAQVESAQRAASRAAAAIPAGEPGECDLCGEHSLRLVRGACARCRDSHKLP